VAACAKPEAGKTTGARESASHTAPATTEHPEDVASPGRARGDAHDGAIDDPLDGTIDLSPFETGRPTWGKPIGHTSVVFKIRLEGGAEAAWKPRSKRGGARYRGEIAAHRLARALGLRNVPLALPRSFSMAELRAAFGDPEAGAGKLLRDEAVPDEHGELHGALIPWIVDLHFLALEAEPKRSEWRSWLAANGVVPSDAIGLASQISTMIVFDYLSGNWDRWSGGQIGTDARGETVLYLDNDGAFFDPPPPEPLAKQRALLALDARFSRRFVAALRALDADATRSAMGEEAPGTPLLAPRVLAGLEERRKAALAIVDARIAKDGEDKVLFFE
jgi:hypothetical protein